MILPAQTIRAISPPIVWPFAEKTIRDGMSYGLSVASYDIRISQTILILDKSFTLASTVERFEMPLDVLGVVHDKSTWARRGITVQNTVIDPGWCGFLTLEITNHSDMSVKITAGMPIAQIIFHRLEEPAERGYEGKYQHQERGPQPALYGEPLPADEH